MMTKLNFEKRVFADCGNVWSEISSFNIGDGTSEIHLIFHIENIHECYKYQLNNICNALNEIGYEYNSDFVNGFIPHYTITMNGTTVLELIVYGSYKSSKLG